MEESAQKKTYIGVVRSLKLCGGALFSFLLLIIFTSAAHAASLYFSPSTGAYTIGQTFNVSVYVSSTEQPMNAADGVISFSKDKLEVVSLSKLGSMINLWVQEPRFSNGDGTVNFEGIVLNPGFTGGAGKILTIAFKARGFGNAALGFASASVLANDGNGTNILDSAGTAAFAIGPGASQSTTPAEELGVPLAPEIISSTHPDPNKWYSKSDARFSWSVPGDATGAQILVGKFPSSIPVVSYTPAIAEKEVTDIPDGQWYIHVRLRNAAGWGAVAHFKFQIDTKAPEPFIVRMNDGKETDNPRPGASFETTDALSGIDYYKIKIGEGEFFTVSAEEAKTSYALPLQTPGKRNIVVQAFDRAGNSTTASEEFTIKPIVAPVIITCPHEFEIGNSLIVKGTAIPNGAITLWIKRDGENPKSQQTKVDTTGDWTLVYGEELTAGIYKMWVVASDERGAMSDPSAICTMVVGRAAFFRIGGLIIQILAVLIPLLALLIVLGLLLYRAKQKLSKMRKQVKKEVHEAEHALHKAFDLLKEGIVERIRLLEKVKTKRELTAEEEKILKEFKEDLTNAEQVINKEIADIEQEIM